MKRLEHESQANEMFVSVTEQYKNEVRSKVIEHIRQTITLIFGYCATEDENLVADMSEISKYEQTIKIEVEDVYSHTTALEIRTLDRLEVDCGDGLWLYDTEDCEHDAKELDTDIIFGIGILIDEWFRNIIAANPSCR